jgi:hypothetical protein
MKLTSQSSKNSIPLWTPEPEFSFGHYDTGDSDAGDAYTCGMADSSYEETYWTLIQGRTTRVGVDIVCFPQDTKATGTEAIISDVRYVRG